MDIYIHNYKKKYPLSYSISNISHEIFFYCKLMDENIQNCKRIFPLSKYNNNLIMKFFFMPWNNLKNVLCIMCNFILSYFCTYLLSYQIGILTVKQSYIQYYLKLWFLVKLRNNDNSYSTLNSYIAQSIRTLHILLVVMVPFFFPSLLYSL